MSCIVCHKVDSGERNLDVGGALHHAGVCDCICELQHKRIQCENMTYHRHREICWM